MSWWRYKVRSWHLPYCCFCSGQKFSAISAVILIIFFSLVMLLYLVLNKMLNISTRPETNDFFSSFSERESLKSSSIESNISWTLSPNSSVEFRFSSFLSRISSNFSATYFIISVLVVSIDRSFLIFVFSWHSLFSASCLDKVINLIFFIEITTKFLLVP